MRRALGSLYENRRLLVPGEVDGDSLWLDQNMTATLQMVGGPTRHHFMQQHVCTTH